MNDATAENTNALSIVGWSPNMCIFNASGRQYSVGDLVDIRNPETEEMGHFIVTFVTSADKATQGVRAEKVSE